MMEQAGLHLARLVAQNTPGRIPVLVGVGTGNNGGGGLVAARRLAAWGYPVSLHIPDGNLRELPKVQLERAMAFGAMPDPGWNSRVFVDAYLGFSQRLPLSPALEAAVANANRIEGLKISLDLPTGFDPATGRSRFRPDIILTLAAMKSELLLPGVQARIFLVDLGIPKQLYREFGVEQPEEFRLDSLIPHRP